MQTGLFMIMPYHRRPVLFSKHFQDPVKQKIRDFFRRFLYIFRKPCFDQIEHSVIDERERKLFVLRLDIIVSGMVKFSAERLKRIRKFRIRMVSEQDTELVGSVPETDAPS